MSYITLKPGDLIISSPFTENDIIFHKSVILITTHDKYGTSGIIVNKTIGKVNSNEIIKSLKLPISNELIKTNVNIIFGGPVEPEKGVILHSSDYQNEPIIKVTPEISISSDTKIISDILSQHGPHNCLLALGYSAWQASQLIEEIKKNEWIILPYEDAQPHSKNFELIFSYDHLYKWNKALKLAGIDISHYTNQKSLA